MLVEYVWVDSDFLNGEWSNDRRVTSYWVRLDRDELAQVLPYLHVEDHESFMDDVDNYTNSPDDPVYLLVAKDLSSIVCLPHQYPISGQWNGYSPFEEIDPVTIEKIEDVKTLSI